MTNYEYTLIAKALSESRPSTQDSDYHCKADQLDTFIRRLVELLFEQNPDLDLVWFLAMAYDVRLDDTPITIEITD